MGYGTFEPDLTNNSEAGTCFVRDLCFGKTSTQRPSNYELEEWVGVVVPRMSLAQHVVSIGSFFVRQRADYKLGGLYLEGIFWLDHFDSLFGYPSVEDEGLPGYSC